MMSQIQLVRAARRVRRRPLRLGFVGLGWIGRSRCEALLKTGLAELSAYVDGDSAARAEAQRLSPAAEHLGHLDELLSRDLDGVVIATPTALHARQAANALERGFPVYCQKPLGRDAAETEQVVRAARRADRLLEVDFCYRWVRGVSTLRSMVRDEIGSLKAVDLVFHNAYGPDKAWYYDRGQSGGGCLIDLGVHLIDLLFWVTGCARVRVEAARILFDKGAADHDGVEDFAAAQLSTDCGACARLACSWRLSAGRDAIIEASFYGTRGAVSFRNLEGSFYDFVVEHYRGTSVRRVAGPPDSWGGRGLIRWVRRLAKDPGFDDGIATATPVAQVIDDIYRLGRGSHPKANESSVEHEARGVHPVTSTGRSPGRASDMEFDHGNRD